MFRFLIRFLALTGLLLAVLAGVALFLVMGANRDLTSDLGGEQGQTVQVMAIVLAAGAALAVIGLIIEVLSAAHVSAGRRSALGINVIVQVLIAFALLIAVNVWSFMHFKRWDCTRDHVFTLRKELKDQLS